MGAATTICCNTASLVAENKEVAHGFVCGVEFVLDGLGLAASARALRFTPSKAPSLSGIDLRPLCSAVTFSSRASERTVDGKILVVGSTADKCLLAWLEYLGCSAREMRSAVAADDVHRFPLKSTARHRWWIVHRPTRRTSRAAPSFS